MELTKKYRKLIDLALDSDIADIAIAENNGVLRISGTASDAVKDRLWNLYGQIDPDMRAGDVVMNVKSDGSMPDSGSPVTRSPVTRSTSDGAETYEIKSGENLSQIAGKYPNMTWQKIYEANKDVIKDPNKVFPGQKIKIPM